jgi:hypothetical protein
MKKAAIPLLLILVLMTSGCTIPGLEFLGLGGPQVVEYENDILIIKSMNAIPSDVAPGQQFRIVAYIENRGKDTIPQRGLKTTMPVTVELYDYCEGLFTINGVTCPPSNSKTSKTGCEITSILPGQIVEVDWVITPKSDIKLETKCPVDGMKVLVRYPYKTTSLTTISIINREEMERQLAEGTFTVKSSYIVAGEGPIKPFLYVEDQQPISQGSLTTVFAFQVENKGSGFLSQKDDKGTVLIPKDNINIKLPTDFCPEKESVKECSLVDSGSTDENGNRVYTVSEGLRLIYGKSPKLFCKVAIPQKNSGEFAGVCSQKEARPIAKESTFTATVDIEYVYEFRSSVSIVVTPKM